MVSRWLAHGMDEIFLLHATTETIRNIVKKTLDEFRSTFQLDDTETLKNKIHDKVKQLPILAHAGKHSELNVQLKQLIGYFQTLGSQLGFSAELFPIGDLASKLK